MELTNVFTVAAPIEEAWPLLTDIERIAPCVPGFKLTGTEDGQYTGTMKVKVGAVQTAYDCTIRFVEVDDEQHRAVIAAQGKETRGQGGVTAQITSKLDAEDGGTRASVVTDLDITGRVAQFGRGILGDVSDRLVKQFVKQLESKLLTPAAAPGAAGPAGGAPAAGTNAGSGTLPPAPEAETEPLDLLSVAGAPLVKRFAPVVAVLAVLAVLGVQLRSRGRR